MSKFFNIRTILAASAVSAAAAVSMFAQTGSASAGVLDCRGNSSNAVLSCCRQEVNQHGRPKWMKEAHESCNTGGISCKGGGGKWGPISHAVSNTPCRYVKIKLPPKDPVPAPVPLKDPKGGVDGGRGGNTKP